MQSIHISSQQIADEVQVVEYLYVVRITEKCPKSDRQHEASWCLLEAKRVDTVSEKVLTHDLIDGYEWSPVAETSHLKSYQRRCCP